MSNEHEHGLVIQCRNCMARSEPSDIMSIIINNDDDLSIACANCKEFVISFPINFEKLPEDLQPLFSKELHLHPIMVHSRHSAKPFKALQFMCMKCDHQNLLSVIIHRSGNMELECLKCHDSSSYRLPVDTGKLPASLWQCACCGTGA